MLAGQKRFRYEHVGRLQRLLRDIRSARQHDNGSVWHAKLDVFCCHGQATMPFKID